ncbi:hypothetical protein B0J13DRAFT_548196 [Dactylonectria estremocensis]|uniref:LPXTG-domain-containing protein n=1 Tax=Dactylonectria estremocensis TaxID=1079267 RepID=A0A9P9JCR9_9HYPO|nr:hypothetical protein B0J13DRAFT_548196 [Dactylonectria estremocensis]
MACRSSSSIALFLSPLPCLVLPLALLLVLSPVVNALQVTPNSPCASFCLASSGLDRSDPSASFTDGDEIVCGDDAFADSTKGKKFQQCLTCLQDSDFSRGEENDQDWFLYNLRYSFDYCIFGYPNASDIGSNPCVTSEACGPLEAALKKGITSPDDRAQYDYCEADDEAMLGSAYESCYSCVRADHAHTYLSNFLVALEAGCQQKPAVGITVGLNATVFSETAIEIIDPSSSDTASSSPLGNTAIAGIAVGGFVVLLVIVGCFYMQYRKRKNRAARSRRARASSLSFRCQTHLTPIDRGFRDGGESPVPMEENHYVDPAAALGSNPIAGASSSPWSPQNGLSTNRTSTKLSSITTALPCPPPVHSSPRQLASPDDYTTPTSTTSTRSNAPLLHHKPYNPADHRSPLGSPLLSPGFTIATPRLTSPGIQRDNWDAESPWEDQPTAGSRRDLMKKASWGSVAPVEARNIQTSFAPPPKK